MSEILVARRYAQALYEHARSTGTVERVDEDVDLLSESLQASRELDGFFRSPVISREKKTAVIDSLFTGRIGQTLLRFLTQLVEKRRDEILTTVLSEYRRLRDGHLGIARAVARSAQPLSDAERELVRGSLETITGRSVQLEANVDQALIGGLIVQIDDTVYDGSVRNKLNHLREQFAAGAHRNN